MNEEDIKNSIAPFGIKDADQLREALEASFFAVIPTNILGRRDISANAKLLYAEILALSRKSGRCFATNIYLGEQLGLSERSIPTLLAELKGTMLVQVNIDTTSGGTYRDITPILIGKGSLSSEGGARSSARGGVAIERGHSRSIQREVYKENSLVVRDLELAQGSAINAQPLVDEWNKYPKENGSCNNHTVNKMLLRHCRGVNKDIDTQWAKLVKSGYAAEDWSMAVQNYIKEIKNRNPKNSYALHRFSCYEFMKQENGFKKFLNR